MPTAAISASGTRFAHPPQPVFISIKLAGKVAISNQYFQIVYIFVVQVSASCWCYTICSFAKACRIFSFTVT